MNRYAIAAILCTVTLTACDAERKDYDSSSYCQSQGMKPGDAGYDKCIQDAKTGRLMDEQQKDFDNMKQKQQDYRMSPYNGYGGR